MDNPTNCPTAFIMVHLGKPADITKHCFITPMSWYYSSSHCLSNNTLGPLATKLTLLVHIVDEYTTLYSGSCTENNWKQVAFKLGAFIRT